MSQKRKDDKHEQFLVKFTCTVTYEGWIVVDGTRDTAARAARKAVDVLEPDELRRSSTHRIRKHIAIGKIVNATTARAALTKASRGIESPYA